MLSLPCGTDRGFFSHPIMLDLGESVSQELNIVLALKFCTLTYLKYEFQRILLNDVAKRRVVVVLPIQRKACTPFL